MMSFQSLGERFCSTPLTGHMTCRDKSVKTAHIRAFCSSLRVRGFISHMYPSGAFSIAVFAFCLTCELMSLKSCLLTAPALHPCLQVLKCQPFERRYFSALNDDSVGGRHIKTDRSKQLTKAL